MANVDIQIRNSTYTITCNEDEVEHIRNLSRAIEARLAGIEKTVGKSSDIMLFVINSVMVEDQLWQLQVQLSALDPKSIEERMLQTLETKLQQRTQLIIGQLVDNIIAKLKEIEGVLENS